MRTRSQEETEVLVRKLIYEQRAHYVTPADFVQRHLDLFYCRDRKPMIAALRDAALLSLLPIIKTRLEEISFQDWTLENLRTALNYLTEQFKVAKESERPEYEMRKLFFEYLRWALYGGRPGLSIPETMLYLGRPVVFQRLSSAEVEIVRHQQ